MLNKRFGPKYVIGLLKPDWALLQKKHIAQKREVESGQSSVNAEKVGPGTKLSPARIRRIRLLKPKPKYKN